MRRYHIAIEGVDATGKTTLVSALAAAVDGVAWRHDIILTGHDVTDAWAFAHARAQFTHERASAVIGRGRFGGAGTESIVVTDRWSLTAEIRHRTAPPGEREALHAVWAAERAAGTAPPPDLVIVLSLPEEAWVQRFRARAGHAPFDRDRAQYRAYETWIRSTMDPEVVILRASDPPGRLMRNALALIKERAPELGL